MNTQTAYPLSWPNAWPRAKYRTSSPFFIVTRATESSYARRGQRSMADSVEDIIKEVRSLSGSGLVISTNVELRNDGLPYSNRKPSGDPGAAVYFKLKGKPCVLACDKWNRVEDNLYAIAKHVEALRGQERWGVGSVEQAFAGYTALPPSGASAGASWWNVIGCAHDAPFEVVKEMYREKAKVFHPDNKLTGDDAHMRLLNNAWDQARAAFKHDTD